MKTRLTVTVVTIVLSVACCAAWAQERSDRPGPQPPATSQPSGKATSQGAAFDDGLSPQDRARLMQSMTPEQAQAFMAARRQGSSTRASTSQATSGKADEVALSLNNAPIDQVAKFISEKRDKAVIPSDSVKNKTVTIVSSRKMKLEEAMSLLREALRQSGIVMDEGPSVIVLRSISEVKQTHLAMVGPNEDLSKMPDKGKIVDKVFAVKHYDVQKIKDLIVPMLPSGGHMTADGISRTLIITDTIGNLERIEQVLKAVDVPEASATETRVFPIHKGDAREIIPIISVLISGSMGKKPKDVVTAVGTSGESKSGGGGPTPPNMPPEMPRGMVDGRGGDSGMMAMNTGQPPSGGEKGDKGKGGAVVVYIEESKTPVVLMAETSRNWIVVVAPRELMGRIAEWIEQFDEAAKVQQVFDIYPVLKADITEISQQLRDSIDAIPDMEVRSSIRIVSFNQSHKLLVFGTQRGRELVRNLLERLDIDSSEFQKQRVFILHYADADDVANDIEALFSNRFVDYESSWGRSYRQERAGGTKIKVVPDTRRNTVTVITDAVTLGKIEKIITEEWDKPITSEDLQPKVYTLQHADPVQVKTILDGMFTQRRRNSSGFSYFFGLPDEPSTPPVGRLFGQFGFQALPNSNKLVVTTKNPMNYAVIDRLIEDLDKPQEAGLPRIIELKHANAEDLGEQLNSLLAEPGTLAEILRSQRNLQITERSTLMPSADNNSGASGNQSKAPEATSTGMMRFWWSRSAVKSNEQPTSNMIGRIRFVPVNRRNALMVLAPQAYMVQLEKLVAELDTPGLQVMIHAVIAEVQHEDTTSLGLRIASNPALLNDPALTDTAIGGTSTITTNQLFGGNVTIGDQQFGRAVLNGNLNVAVLIQMLIKNFGMRVMTEPKLYTADNQQADFFDGQDVPVIDNSKSSTEGTSLVTQYKYLPVGANLSVRPHITEEGGVDLNINLTLSSIVPGATVQGNVVFDRRETTTHVIVKDGQTVMLSGIIRQEDFEEVRKVPLLGDIPGLGLLFRSVNKAKRNRELIAFITPYVITDRLSADKTMAPAFDSLKNIQRDMGDGGSGDRVRLEQPTPATAPGTAPGQPATPGGKGKPSDAAPAAPKQAVPARPDTDANDESAEDHEALTMEMRQ